MATIEKILKATKLLCGSSSEEINVSFDLPAKQGV